MGKATAAVVQKKPRNRRSKWPVRREMIGETEERLRTAGEMKSGAIPSRVRLHFASASKIGNQQWFITRAG
jgi:hypothetical protein